MKLSLATAFLFISLCGASIGYASEEVAGVIARHPSPSPTGTEVVFEADFDGPLNLWVVGINGQNLRKLTTNPGVDEEAAWSPDGKTIAFASTKADATDIWSIQPDGSHLTQLTSNSLNNRQPAWSPDAKQIAFVSDRGGTNDIWIMNADGSSQMRLTNLPGEEDHPSFSPDGTQIVFSETIKDIATLRIVNVDGSDLQSLTTDSSNDWNPSWSIRGILFSSNRGGSEHWKIWLIQPDGSGLTLVGDTIGLDPVWLPDGRILFSDELSGLPIDLVHAAITVLDPVSGGKQPVTSLASHRLLSLSPVQLWAGLKNSDDIGTQFDLRADVYKNGSPVALGQIL